MIHHGNLLRVPLCSDALIVIVNRGPIDDTHILFNFKKAYSYPRFTDNMGKNTRVGVCCFSYDILQDFSVFLVDTIVSIN